MSNPYIGEIRIVGGNFAPVGWPCAGAIAAIAGKRCALHLIGTTYGGDGQTNFNLRTCRAACRFMQARRRRQLCDRGDGRHRVRHPDHRAVADHNHGMASTGQPGSTNHPGAECDHGRPGTGPAQRKFLLPAVRRHQPTAAHPQSIALSGGSQPHDNIQPYQALNFIIALEGIFPTQN